MKWPLSSWNGFNAGTTAPIYPIVGDGCPQGTSWPKYRCRDRDKTKVEDAFKHIKSFLKIRPFYVNLDEHVRAVYSICVLSYFLNKDLAERRKRIDGIDYLNSKNLYEPFRSCHCVTLKDKPSGSKKRKTVELTLEQKRLLKELQIKIKMPLKIM